MCVLFIFHNQIDFFSIDLPTSNNPNREKHEKNSPKTGKTEFKRGDFPKSYIPEEEKFLRIVIFGNSFLAEFTSTIFTNYHFYKFSQGLNFENL